MKLEIEITEDEIKSAIERKIRVALADHSGAWNVDAYIKERVTHFWKLGVDARVEALVGGSEALKRLVDKEVDKRIASKIAKMLREGAK